MQFFAESRKPYTFDLRSQIALVLTIALLLWLTGAPNFFRHANAANVTSFSDTLSDSRPSTAASSTLRFTTQNIWSVGATTTVSFDPGTGSFTQAFTAATSAEYSLNAGGTYYQVVNDCNLGSAPKVLLKGTNFSSATNALNYQICPGSSAISASTIIVLAVGTSSGNVLTNPATAGQSYVVRLGGSSGISGDTRVAIVNGVTVTASVDTSFTFTVAGMATTTTVNGTTTTIGTTATLIPFTHNGGSLQVGFEEVGSQRLNVSTNATHGYLVTVHETQHLTDSSGDDIDQFKDGSNTSAPTAWAAPTNTIAGGENTYGHFGLTTSDSDNAGLGTPGFAAFGSNNFVGDFYSTTTRGVLYNDGPTDGVLDNAASTTVGYAIQIGSLQQAGNDYNTTLVYVATPTF